MLVFAAVSCGQPPTALLNSFQSQNGNGKRTYLITHYDVLTTADNGTVSNPFGSGEKLTAAQLTLTREQLNRVGQCLYLVSSDHPLSAHTPQAFTEMLAKAEPLTREQKYVPLDRVYHELQDLRDIYGQRLPWYYHYMAIGGVLVVLNGLFDIVTHDAQGEAIKFATEYVQSDHFRREMLKQSFVPYDELYETITATERYYDDIFDEYSSAKVEKMRERSVDAIEEKIRGSWRGDLYEINKKHHKLIVEAGRAEHKLEELFGRLIYAGHDVKIGGRSINLNPLWALKQKSGEKFVPLVQKANRISPLASVVTVAWISIAATVIVTAAVPLTYYLTGKVNAWLHREQEQRTLLDIVGNWDSFRTFTLLQPKDMQKLQQKMAKLSKRGTQPCPPANELAAHYIDKDSGRFY